MKAFGTNLAQTCTSHENVTGKYDAKQQLWVGNNASLACDWDFPSIPTDGGSSGGSSSVSSSSSQTVDGVTTTTSDDSSD